MDQTSPGGVLHYITTNNKGCKQRVITIKVMKVGRMCFVTIEGVVLY